MQAVDTSTVFNQFYETFMTELGLSFPGNASVAEIQGRFHDLLLEDPAAPAVNMAKDTEGAMETLMSFDANTAGEAEMNAVLRCVGATAGMLNGLELPETAEGGEAEVSAMLQNKAGTIDYIRNLALTAIGLAHMPPGVLEMISSMTSLCEGDDGEPPAVDSGSMDFITQMLGPMLGPMMGPMMGMMNPRG